MPDPSGSFRTHAAYLQAMTRVCGFQLFGNDANVMATLAMTITASPTYTSQARVHAVDLNQVRLSLHAAWGTEVLLGLTGRYAPEDLVGLGNSWGAVQTYYAGYHATQAWIVARGAQRPTTHQRTQALYIDLWVTPPRLLKLFSLGATESGYQNVPAGRTIDETVHPWVTCDDSNCWDITCKAFRTTREETVPEVIRKERVAKRAAVRKAWQAAENVRLAAGRRPRKRPEFPFPRLTPNERARIRAGVRAHGLLDYLYRLRVRAQYEDATMFTEGPDSNAQSVLVYRDLGRLTGAMLMLHELHVKQAIGRAVFERLVDRWLTQNSPPVNPLSERRALLLP